MVLLNLLPYREWERERRERRWRLLLGMGAAAGLLASAAFYWQGQIHLQEQQRASAVLEEALQALARQAEEAQRLQETLRQGRSRLQQWQAWRLAAQSPARLLRLLGEDLPLGVVVQRLEQTPGQIELQGQASHPEAVTALREVLEGSGLSPQPVLLADVHPQQGGHAFRITLPLPPDTHASGPGLPQPARKDIAEGDE